MLCIWANAGHVAVILAEWATHRSGFSFCLLAEQTEEKEQLELLPLRHLLGPGTGLLRAICAPGNWGGGKSPDFKTKLSFPSAHCVLHVPVR